MSTATRVAPPAGEALLSSRLDRYLLFDRVNRPYLRWQVEQFRPYLGRRILEIGCGVGGIIDLLGARELVYGLDVEEEVLAYAARRFRDRPECRFALLDVTRAPAERLADLKAQRFDSIVCVNVLEHIADDLGALRRMESLLEPGGILALLVPAHQALYGPYDELDGHFRRYDKRRLRGLLRRTGLRTLSLRYFNTVGAVGWWVQYKLLRRTIHGEGQFGVMNRVLPVVRRLEQAVSPPFGLSVVAVCRRVGA
jgi:SAM-dependent methyltransferase